MSGRCLLPPAIALLALVGNGCAIDTHYRVSRPEDRSGSQRGEATRFDVVVRDPGYRLRVEAMNRQEKSDTTWLGFVPITQEGDPVDPGHLTVWLGVEDKDHDTGFDPFRTSLVTADGRSWHPTLVSGGSMPASWKKCRSVARRMTVSTEVPIDGRGCFRVVFAARVGPDETFELRVEGLYRGNELVPLPPVRFTEGRYTDSQSAP